MATTTNYGWTTPDDTALVKDGAAAIRTLGTSIDTTTKNLNPSTTLGDIEYRSSTANTNTRLAIGSTGNVLTVAGGVPTWAAPAAGSSGLNLIATDSFSAVSSITKDSLFSSTYDNYRILIELTASATASFNLYLRSGGSNITSGYSRQTFSADDTSLLGARTTNTSEATVANSLSTGRNYVILDIASPFLTQDKAIISQALNTFNTVISQDYKNVLSTASSCAGIYFFPNTGNITGKVSYYGYGK